MKILSNFLLIYSEQGQLDFSRESFTLLCSKTWMFKTFRGNIMSKKLHIIFLSLLVVTQSVTLYSTEKEAEVGKVETLILFIKKAAKIFKIVVILSVAVAIVIQRTREQVAITEPAVTGAEIEQIPIKIPFESAEMCNWNEAKEPLVEICDWEERILEEESGLLNASYKG